MDRGTAIQMAYLSLSKKYLFILACYLVVGYFGFGKAFRIQDKNSSLSDNLHDVFWSIITPLSTVILSFFAFEWLWRNGIMRFPEKRSLTETIFYFSLFFLLADYLKYWYHRINHHPFLYRHIHYIHHKNHTPTALTSMAEHPIQAIIGRFVTNTLAQVLVPIEFAWLQAYFIFATIHDTNRHMGIDPIGAMLGKLGLQKWIVSSAHHDLHHSEVNTNYAFFFSFWDVLHKTYDPKTDELVRSLPRR